MDKAKSLRLRRFLVLFLGGLFGAYAVIPHLGRHLGQFVADAVLIGLAATVGTRLTSGTALQTPFLDAALSRRAFVRRRLGIAGQALLVGLVASGILVGLDRTLFASHVSSTPPLWTGALHALSGGISEEVVFHYGLLTALAWVFLRLTPGDAPYWIAIVISAVGLGLSHLTGALLPMASPAGIRSVVLTALVGIVTGWLYWRRSLESAMLSHGVIAFALHVAAPGV